jgi:serine/threonine-protein kinase SRPK3
VIVGRKYDTSADIWSFACFVFELITGDLLFDPSNGRNFNRDEDHLAQMIELLGKMPKSFTASARGAKDFFNRKGELRRIRNLKFWSLKEVLIEKYSFSQENASSLASFLEPMLRYNTGMTESLSLQFVSCSAKRFIYVDKRATAEEMLEHPWLELHR